jgi:DNA-binding transcriptional ArsR family regulator
MSNWKIISNHGVILAYVAVHPQSLAVDIASAIGIRERTVRRIIADLASNGYLEKERVGRSNLYRVNIDAPLRRPIMSQAKVGDLLETIQSLIES